MPPQLALLLSLGFSAALLWRELKHHPEVSKAVWIPCIWLFILGSRAVSQWLDFSTPNSADALMDGSPLDRAIFMLLMAIALVILWRRKISWGSVLSNNPALAIFFAYCAISVIWSDFAGVAFKRWFKSLGDPLMVLVLLTEVSPSAAVGAVLRRCAFVLVPLSIVFIKYFPHLGRVYDQWSGVAFNTGVTTNKNTLGGVLLVVGLYFFCTLFTKPVSRNQPADQARDHVHRSSRRRRTDLAIAAVFLLMIGWLFQQADSQTPFIALIFAATLVSGLALPVVRRHFGSFAAAGIFIGVLLQLLVNVSGLIIEGAGRDTTLTGRTDIWAAVLALQPNPLLGAGFQSFWLGDRLVEMWQMFPVFRPNQAHNGYIETYLNLGWVGVFLFICILIGAYRTVRQRLLNPDGMARSMRTEDPVLAKFGTGFLFAFILYNVTEAVFVPLGVPFIAFLVLTLRAPTRPASHTELARHPARRTPIGSRWTQTAQWPGMTVNRTPFALKNSNRARFSR
jgi:exopolysaccharide production protein ExoQ